MNNEMNMASRAGHHPSPDSQPLAQGSPQSEPHPESCPDSSQCPQCLKATLVMRGEAWWTSKHQVKLFVKHLGN